MVEHQGWAESIARSVARAWSMDWRLDGLDGAAMEALIFCARRFEPARGIPFKGYARKRIHEASTEAARKCKSWRNALAAGSSSDNAAREISAELLNVFPGLRSGQLSSGEDGEDTRSSIRQLLVGATVIAAKQGVEGALPDEIIDYKRMVMVMTKLDAVHQLLLWKVYWEGMSMRSVAVEWETDELTVIREHKALLDFLAKGMNKKDQSGPPLKVRPALKAFALQYKKKSPEGPFSKLIPGTT